MKIDPDLDITEADVLAIRACMAGTASADQQQRAMQWIAAGACRLFEPEFVTGERPLETAFNGGRRYVGLLLAVMKEPSVLAHARERDRGISTRGKSR